MRLSRHLLTCAVIAVAVALPIPDQNWNHKHTAYTSALVYGAIGMAGFAGYTIGETRWGKQEKDICEDLIVSSSTPLASPRSYSPTPQLLQESWYNLGSARDAEPRNYGWTTFDFREALCKNKRMFLFAQETWRTESRLPTPTEINDKLLERGRASSSDLAVQVPNPVANKVNRVLNSVGRVINAAGGGSHHVNAVAPPLRWAPGAGTMRPVMIP